MVNKYLKYFNMYLGWIIFILILLFKTITSNACPEYKVTWLLIEIFIFMFAYKFWQTEVRYDN